MKAKLCLVTLLMFCLCLPAVYGDEEEIENLLINPSIEEAVKDDVLWRTGNPNSFSDTLSDLLMFCCCRR